MASTAIYQETLELLSAAINARREALDIGYIEPKITDSY
jgi:hypothetical protein